MRRSRHAARCAAVAGPAAWTWAKFLDDHYEPFATANLKSATETLRRLRVSFAEFAETPLRNRNAFAVERWRMALIKAGKKPATIQRDLDSVKTAFARAVEWKLLKSHPLQTVKIGKRGHDWAAAVSLARGRAAAAPDVTRS